MTDHDADHDELVRASFTRQVGLFSGPDSPFVRRPAGTVEQLEPLHDDMVVLDVCCGAADAAEVVAPRVRQVPGVDLTPSLLDLGAARLGAAGVRNVVLQEGNAHRRLDPSHRRAHVESELVALLPDHVELTHAQTTETRMPIAIAYTAQSDVDTAEAVLRAELAGGPVTGLEPLEEDGTLTVSFWTSTIQATRR